MENRERVSGEETHKNNIKAGAFKPNPTRYNRNTSGIDSAGDAGEGDEEGANFDQENNEPEINPGQLDREEIDLDRTGPDNSPSKQDLNARSESDNQQGGDRGLNETSGNKSVKKPAPKENLLGQGGYGTSGTSGTNSGGKQGYQSGLGSAGSQNGSTGYNAGSQGIDQTKGA
jgi:hypothetical protein